MELRDGVNTGCVWSSPELRVGRDADGRDVLLLSGPEPDMAWHRFAAHVADLAEQLGVTQMAALGAYPFATPHTRPPHLSATSPSADVLAGLPFRTSSVDVPAGMAAALEHALHERGIPALGIWAQVPALRGVDVVPGGVGGAARRAGHGDRHHASTAADLRREAVLQRERLDQLVDGNDEHQAMVAQFERLYDAADEQPRSPERRRRRRARAALRRRARRRGRALPARPGQELRPPPKALGARCPARASERHGEG